MEAVLNRIQLERNLTNREKNLLRFTAVGLFYDLTKLFILFVFFACIKETVSFLFCFFVLMILRKNQGGLHLKHYITCLIASFLYFFLAICVMPMLPVPNKPICMLGLFTCILINYLIGPIKNLKVYKEYKDPDTISRARLQNFEIIFAYFLIYFVLLENMLLYKGMWIIIFHSLQMMAAYIRKEVKVWAN